MKCLAAAVGFFLCAFASAAAAPPQTLLIATSGNEAVARSLATYVSGAPIAVRVTVPPGAAVDDVRVGVTGPSSPTQQTALRRATDGSFSGTLVLDEAGTWNVSITTASHGLATNSAPVVLRVVAPAPDYAWLVGLAVGGGLFLIAVGVFLRLRRTAVIAPAVEARAA